MKLITIILLTVLISFQAQAQDFSKADYFAEGYLISFKALEYQGNDEDTGDGYGVTLGVNFLEYFAAFVSYDRVTFIDTDYTLLYTAKATYNYFTYGLRVQVKYLFAFYRQGINKWSYTECPINTGEGEISVVGQGIGIQMPFSENFAAFATGETRKHGDKKDPSEHELLTAGLRINF